MTVPTQYNGKPIPSGTWLANAAEVVGGEAEKNMSAPTPDSEWDLLLDNAERLGENNPDSWEFSAHEVNLVLSRLAAVVAERDYERTQHEITKDTLDQAWEELHASKQMHEQARSLLDQTLTERDAAQADNHNIADMYRFVVKQLADAPHQTGCFDGRYGEAGICSCWKAGL